MGVLVYRHQCVLLVATELESLNGNLDFGTAPAVLPLDIILANTGARCY